MLAKNNFCFKTARLAFVSSWELLDGKKLLGDSCESFDLREPHDEFDFISYFNFRHSKRWEVAAHSFSQELCHSCCSFIRNVIYLLLVLFKFNQFTNSCIVLSAEFFSTCNALCNASRSLVSVINFSTTRSLWLNSFLQSRPAFFCTFEINSQPFLVIFWRGVGLSDHWSRFECLSTLLTTKYCSNQKALTVHVRVCMKTNPFGVSLSSSLTP